MKRLLPLVLVICAAIGCTPKHNLEIRLKGFHNDTLILGVMPLSDYIVNNYDNMQTQTLVAQDGVIKTIDLPELVCDFLHPVEKVEHDSLCKTETYKTREG